MTKFIFGAALLSAAFFSTAVLADETQSANQPTVTAQTKMMATPAATTTDLNNQVVCASSIHDGTVVKRPTCMTRDERTFRRLQEQQNLRDIQARSLTTRLW